MSRGSVGLPASSPHILLFMRRVGFWPRLFATVLDLVFFSPALFAYGLIDTIWPEAFAASPGVEAAFFPLAWLAYSSTEIWFAATPGKLIFYQRIATARGDPADFWTRFLRWETKQLPAIAAALLAATHFFPFLLIRGFMSTIVLWGCLAALNEDRRAWHDEWAGTSVVIRRPKTLPPPLPVS